MITYQTEVLVLFEWVEIALKFQFLEYTIISYDSYDKSFSNTLRTKISCLSPICLNSDLIRIIHFWVTKLRYFSLSNVY